MAILSWIGQDKSLAEKVEQAIRDHNRLDLTDYEYYYGTWHSFEGIVECGFEPKLKGFKDHIYAKLKADGVPIKEETTND